MEDQQAVMRRLDDIYSEVESVRRMTELGLRARKEEIEPTILAGFSGAGGESLRKCYLAADGIKTQEDIVRETGVPKATVSRALRKLHQLGIVEPVQQQAANISVYGKNLSYERVFQLSEKLAANRE